MVLQTTGLLNSILLMLIANRQQATYSEIAWYLDRLLLANSPTDIRPEHKAGSVSPFQTITVSTINSSVSLSSCQIVITNATTSANSLYKSQVIYKKNQGAGSSISDVTLSDNRHAGLDMTSVAPRILVNINLRRK